MDKPLIYLLLLGFTLGVSVTMTVPTLELALFETGEITFLSLPRYFTRLVLALQGFLGSFNHSSLL